MKLSLRSVLEGLLWLAGLAATTLAAAQEPYQAAIQCVVKGNCPRPATDPTAREGFAIQLAPVFHFNPTARLSMMPGAAFAGASPGTRGKAPEPPADDAQSLVQAGNSQAIEGNYPGATRQFESALRLVPERQDLQAKAAALTGICAVLAVQGRYADARAPLEQALAAYTDLAARPVAPGSSPSAIAQSQAAMAKQMSRYGVDPNAYALNSATNPLVVVANQMEERMAVTGVVRSMLNLANLTAQLGQYAEAELQMQRALAEARKSTELGQDLSRTVQFELAAFYRATSKTQQADAAFNQAQATPATANAVASAGVVSLGRGSARAQVADASTTAGAPDKAPSHEVEVVQQALQAQAEAFEAVRDSTGALTAYSHAATLAIAMNNPERARYALAQSQRILEARGNRDAAILFGKRAVNTAQRLRVSMVGMDRQARQAYLADKRRSYTMLARTLIDAERLDEAELVLRLLKEDEGQQFLDRGGSAAHGEMPYASKEAAVLARYDTFASRTGELEQRREQLASQLMGRSIDSRKTQEEMRVTYGLAMEAALGGLETVYTAPRLADMQAGFVAASRKPIAEQTPQERQLLRDFGPTMHLLADRVAIIAAGLRALQRDAPRFLSPPGPAETARIDALQGRASRLDDGMRKAVQGLPDLPPGVARPEMPTMLMMYFGGMNEVMQSYWAIDRELETLDLQRAALDANLAAELGAAGALQFGDADRAVLEAGRKLIGALPPGTVAIYYLASDNRLDALMVTRESRRAFQQALPRDALDRNVQTLRSALQDPARDPRAPARALYDVLVGPLDGALRSANAKTLMLSLDGQLRYLPFGALHDGQGWLAQRYALDLYTTAMPAALSALPAPRWQVAAFGSTRGGANYPPLEGVRVELAGIVRDPKRPAQGVLNGSARLDDDFTAAALRNAFRGPANVIHIASHFRFSPGDATQSALLLGDGTLLSLAQLAGSEYRFAHVDLVTLSACETGLSGDDRFGQEVEGMGTLLQGQGAAAVLATLWEVDDASTAEFMKALYGARESRRLSRAEAVRQAQLGLINGAIGAPAGAVARGAIRPGTASSTSWQLDPAKPYAHPFYWAPFVLMGNWL